MLLLCSVRNCRDDVEYHMYQQQWDTINRPQHVRRTWSPRQEEVLGAVAFAVSLDDELQKSQHTRRLFVSGGLDLAHLRSCWRWPFALQEVASASSSYAPLANWYIPSHRRYQNWVVSKTFRSTPSTASCGINVQAPIAISMSITIISI